MTKEEVAAHLELIGTLMELRGDDAFRTKAYHGAARTIEQLEGDFDTLIATGKLAKVRGIGETLREVILSLAKTGTADVLEELRAVTPPGLIAMLRIPGLGPKKVRALNTSLGIDSLETLRVACIGGKVAGLKGFGEKTQQKILDGLTFIESVGERVRIDQSLPLGLMLLERIRALPGVLRAELCGSLRRRRETSKDIDLLVAAEDSAPIMQAFCTLPEVRHIVGQGETKSSIVAEWVTHGHRITLGADLRVVKPDQFASALVHFTGSKEHNIRLRQLATDRGWKLNEYELAGPNSRVACETEADLYAALGLDWIAPELREDTGEIEAATQHALPKLVEASDIRGVFHNHTTYSDGVNTLEEMALAAKALGFEYLGIGDHSQSLTVARGLSPERVRHQIAEIDRLNQQLDGFRILKGIECDILKNGDLDYDDDLLAELDYVVISVHTYFDLPIEEQTARICKALRHPATTMLGHATGRLLLRRDGYKVNLDEVLQTAAEHRKMIEINAQPSRLDLDWIYVKRAKALGIPLVINPDAHSTDELALFRYGVNVARRGWLTPQNVFNTLPLPAILQSLRIPA
ncbi:DNA polymerase/3'-5' exonuclease PolX [Tuwongella immobilis]|uniref:DNA polymerase beta n=1 Tax=Tuwongella immobilis TaxID=692036 RepID=A0A6C2YGI9_9BACT|nr:DNA polymerase/3'-5' exonuclease PolX [Tuwongella immobilis]VIP00606.1 histidinol phosphatase : DNA polymerase IV (Family X) OS=Singulisphaera acidiphila (strain ATCC BAA-1392 / DSM 18658 / VKM B-2454 / MOB10) GN=Sinac_2234 PE=4 SV=1: HHH_8: DNA_pol_B_thumb: PHP [Tuwongella immobilis]VTR96630.1 histidinol phosphatase : DNA polymerase IV (Family X) OS=Singulisphaera acidiphila (strain ATCC BAA-1392 / DSM 18658 / VKM B-2454 / MOB10) GN=Sinac_2234 PE=4 SV=1: HHH_8: DNA_pol_B_thumb: PHP [Tuwongell